MNKTWGVLTAGALLTGLLVGCGGEDSEQKASPSEAPSSAVTASVAPSSSAAVKQEKAAWPRTYSDGLNKEVIIEKEPKKVAVLHFGYVEYLLALGVDPMAAAQKSSVEAFKTLSPYTQMSSIIDVGQAMSPNLEKLIELQPDLIIATPGLHDNAYDSLAKISTVVYKKTYGGWKDTLNDYAQLLGREEQAAVLVKETEATIKDTREKLAAFKDKTFVFVRPAAKGGFSIVGTKQFTHYHDAVNGFGLKTPEKYPENFENVSLEALAAMNPDYIFFQDKQELSQKLVDSLANDAVWKSIQAVQDGHVDYLDVSLNTSSPLAIQLASKEITASLLK
jgi:iron complex transport system substrate-binding protein